MRCRPALTIPPSVSTYPGGCGPPATLAFLQRPGRLLSALPGTLCLRIFPWLIPLPSPVLGLLSPTTSLLLCVSLACPQTWTVYLLSNLKAWPKETTQHTLSHHSSKETSSSYPAKTPSLQPKVTLTCGRPMKSEPTTFLEQAVNHSANTSDVARTHLCPQPGAPAPAPTSL